MVIWVFFIYMIVNVFCKCENFLLLYCINFVLFLLKLVKILLMFVVDIFFCIEFNNVISFFLFKVLLLLLLKF